MTANRKHKHVLYNRLAQLPLRWIAASAQLGLPYYILKGHQPVAVPFWKQLEWMRAQNHGSDRATVTIALSRAGAYRVSTIFLGLDHGFGSDGGPVLFETMAFMRKPDGKGDFRNEQYRYRTWKEAIRGHRQFAARLATMRAVAPPAERVALDGGAVAAALDAAADQINRAVAQIHQPNKPADS